MQKNHFTHYSQKISAYDADNTHLRQERENWKKFITVLTLGLSSKEKDAGKVCAKLSNSTMRSRSFTTSREGFVRHNNCSSEIFLKKRNYMPVLPFQKITKIS